jgi:hypothetical protein
MRVSETFFLVAVLYASTTLATPVTEHGHSKLERRGAEVKHDSLNALAQNLDNSATAKTIKTFQPSLYIDSGCQPYPAIDDKGNWRYV